MLELEKNLGYEFKNRNLLLTALTHSSYANENRKEKIEYNERLEFLGDSVLGMVVAEHLFKCFPNMPEGQMSRMRAELVCEQSLEKVARQLGLGRCLRLGRGEEQNGGRERKSILADATESVIAAVYLDGGKDAAAEVITRFVLSKIEAGTYVIEDYKTSLQEFVQKKSGQTLKYELTGESGPDHNKTFSAAVFLNGQCAGEGQGRNKKEAEQMAARQALEVLKRES